MSHPLLRSLWYHWSHLSFSTIFAPLIAFVKMPCYHLLEDGLQSLSPQNSTAEKPPTKALAIFCTIWVLILVGVLLYVVKDQGNREVAAIRATCTSDVQKLEEMIISKNQEIETLQMKISELEGLELTPTPTRLVVTEEGKDEERAKLEEEAKKGNSQWPLEKGDEEEKNENGEYPEEPAME